jgi:hypothetical protein
MDDKTGAYSPGVFVIAQVDESGCLHLWKPLRLQIERRNSMDVSTDVMAEE